MFLVLTNVQWYLKMLHWRKLGMGYTGILYYLCNSAKSKIIPHSPKKTVQKTNKREKTSLGFSPIKLEAYNLMALTPTKFYFLLLCYVVFLSTYC